MYCFPCRTAMLDGGPLDTPREEVLWASCVTIYQEHFHPRQIWDRMFACYVGYKENREEMAVEAT